MDGWEAVLSFKKDESPTLRITGTSTLRTIIRYTTQYKKVLYTTV